MPEDRGLRGAGPAVVEKRRAGSQSPERRRAHEATRGRSLSDPVPERPHVVQEEVRVRVECFVRQGGHRARAGDERGGVAVGAPDRKSTRLNSSHGYISYAVFCLKKKKVI